MNTIFGSVIYPDAVQYAGDFIKSLEKQTDRDFSLLLINDGVSHSTISMLMKGCGLRYEIVNPDIYLSPTQLRILLISEAKNRNADYLIFGDIDDFFAENRIEETVNAFSEDKKLVFVYNRFCLFDGGSLMPALPSFVNSIHDILEYNFLGLSNSAIRLCDLNREFIDSTHECTSQVFDWYLFCRLVLLGGRGRNLSNTKTYYRLHDRNIAGLITPSVDEIGKEIQIKVQHYKTLSVYNVLYRELFDLYIHNAYEHIIQNEYYWWNLTRRKKK